MSQLKEKNKVTLEHLLSLKKQEKPSSEFWESFESTFEHRRLRALVERPRFWTRFSKPILKAAFLFVPATAVYVFSTTYLIHNPSPENSKSIGFAAVDFSGNEDEVSSSAILHPESNSVYANDTIASGMGSADSKFILDNYSNSNGNGYFRKVLYSPTLSIDEHANNRTQYVDNPITRNNSYRVAPAVIKAGYNF